MKLRAQLKVLTALLRWRNPGAHELEAGWVPELGWTGL